MEGSKTRSRYCASKVHRKEGMTEPVICGPHLRLCDGCIRHAKGVLCRLADRYKELESELVRRPSRRPFLVPRVAKLSGNIPLNDEVVEVRAWIRGIVRSWSSLVADHRGAGQRPDEESDIRDATEFLLRNLSWLAKHEAAGEFVDEITELGESAELHEHQPGKGEYLCISASCSARLVIQTDGTPDQGTIQIRCAQGHCWTPADFFQKKRETYATGDENPLARAGVKIPTKTAALFVGVSASTIRQWVRRGKLTRYGSEAEGLYDLDELAKLARSASQ